MLAVFIDGLSPAVFVILVFIALLAIEQAGVRVGRRIGPPRGDATTAALTTGLAAVFAIVALVLSFSFSFSLTRYEQRFALVVQEANDIGTAYLRTSVLNPRDGEKLRDLLRAYTADRIDLYRDDADAAAKARDQSTSDDLQARIWTIVSQTLSAHPQNLGASLMMQETNDMIDISAEQRAVLGFRLGGSALFLVFFVAALGALAIGVVFGFTDFNTWFVGCIFSLLLTLLLYTIIDLDAPQSGFIRVNLAPLYQQQQSMAVPP